MEYTGPLAAAVIRSARKAFASGAALRMQERHPEWMGALGDFAALTAQNETLLDHLSAALEVERPRLFEAQVAWLLESCAARGVTLEGMREKICCLRDEVARELPARGAPYAVECIEGALREFDRTHPGGDVRARSNPAPYARLVARYLDAALAGDHAGAVAIVIEAHASGVSPSDLRRHVLAPAQVELGDRWQRSLASVADEHLCSRTTERALSVLSERAPRVRPSGVRILVTSASGDLHDIGLRMVSDELEGTGHTVAFLGADTPTADLVRMKSKFQPHVIAIGARLSIHLHGVLDMIAALRTTDGARSVPVLVGGAPFELVPDLWRVVGADASAATPLEAVGAVGRLLARP